MYCDNCEVLVVEHFNFCPGCGEAIRAGFSSIEPCIRQGISNNLT